MSSASTLRVVTMSPEVEEEDFGFVLRDTNLLQKALTSDTGSSPSGEGDNTTTGSQEADVVQGGRQGTSANHGLEQDNKGAATTLSVDNSHRDKVDVVSGGGHDHHQKEDNTTKKGILKGTMTSDQLSYQKKNKSSSNSMKTMSASTGPEKEDLPQSFQVKYLGHQDARGLWGIKHTRRPVDNMVTAAKSLRAGIVLPLVKLVVTKDGVIILPPTAKSIEDGPRTFYSIDTISYGVQDLVYTRVFSMIVVKDSGANAKEVHPFECHAYVCESRHSARRLTYSLAAAFQEYSKMVHATGGPGDNKDKVARIKKRFAIDLRSPDEIEADLEDETEA